MDRWKKPPFVRWGRIWKLGRPRLASLIIKKNLLTSRHIMKYSPQVLYSCTTFCSIHEISQPPITWWHFHHQHNQIFIFHLGWVKFQRLFYLNVVLLQFYCQTKRSNRFIGNFWIGLWCNAYAPFTLPLTVRTSGMLISKCLGCWSGCWYVAIHQLRSVYIAFSSFLVADT